MIAVIAGGTGLTGRELIRQLEQNPRITEIRALVRTPGRLPASPKLREILLPPSGFEGLEDSTDPPLSGDVYFCALGTTIRKAGSQDQFRKIDHDAVVSFAKLCAKRDGRSFGLISASGASPASRIFYSRVKGEAEQDVLKLSIPRIVIARPSLLIGDRDERRPAERAGIVVFRALAPILPSCVRRLIGTSVPELIERLIGETMTEASGRIVVEASKL
jgi:uncharacterized protein YbjT (DUF2867 family)